MGGKLGEHRLELADGVADPTGDGLASSLGRVVGELARAARAGDPAELVDELLPLGLRSGAALEVVARGGVIDLGIELEQTLPVGVEGTAVDDVACRSRSVRCVLEVERMLARRDVFQLSVRGR